MQDNLLICVKRHACVHSSDHNGHTLNITSSPDFNSSVLKTYNIHANYKMYRRNTWHDMKIIRMDVPPPLSFFLFFYNPHLSVLRSDVIYNPSCVCVCVRVCPTYKYCQSTEQVILSKFMRTQGPRSRVKYVMLIENR